ncbi:MAG: hypothetical protein SGJ26_00320 [Nitrospirota bacterium]|nr:hypothetical protein [Nitrospirota bacterium]
MGRIKHAIDPPLSTAWIARVGKLILNFGVLELETYLWLVQLSEDTEKLPEFSKLRFAQRVEKLMELAKKRAYSEIWEAEAQKFWNEALDLAKFRNRIAHSPLTFGWNKEAEEGEPDFIGIVDLQRRDSSQNALASKAEMDGVINSIVSLATQLSNLRIDWCAIRDSRHKSRTNA